MKNRRVFQSVFTFAIALLAVAGLASCDKGKGNSDTPIASVPSPQICAQSTYQPDWYNQTGFQSYNWSYVSTTYNNGGWQNPNQYNNGGHQDGEWVCKTPFEFGETYCYRHFNRRPMPMMHGRPGYQPMMPGQQPMMPGQQMPYPNQQMPYPNQQMPYPNNGMINQQAQIQSFSTGFCGCQQQQSIPACGPQGMVCIPVTVNLTNSIAIYSWNQTTNAFIAGGFQTYQSWSAMRTQNGCASVMAQACDTRTPSCTSGRCVATGTNGLFGGLCVQ